MRIARYVPRSQADDYRTLASRSVEAAANAKTVPTILRKVARGSVDVVHVDWPEQVVWTDGYASALRRAGKFLALIAAAKLRGIPVVWTVHNLRPHESDRQLLTNAAYSATVRFADACIHLSQAAMSEALRTYPSLRGCVNRVIPHGHYRDVYSPTKDSSLVREELGLADSEVVLGFVGKVRAYKGVEELLRAFSGTTDPSLRLLVAGEAKDERLLHLLEDSCLDDSRIVLHSQHIPASEMANVISAVDLGVLPYRRGLNSGAALLFLSFNKPILAPPWPQFDELGRMVGEMYVMRNPGQLTAGDLESAASRAVALRGQRPSLEDFEWSSVGQKHAELYHSLVRR